MRHLIFGILLAISSVSAFAGAEKKILFILTNEERLGNGAPSGIHFNELTHPYYSFVSAGYEVEFGSIKGGNAPVDPATLDQVDPLNKRFWTNSSLRRKLSNSKSVRELKASDYAGIFVVGGVSTMWDFPNSPALTKLIAENYEKGGVIGAVCHGPAALVNVKLSNGQPIVKGKMVSSFTNEEEVARNRENIVPFLLETELVKLGAKFTKAPAFKYHVVTDGRLVTGQNPASAFGVAHEMILTLSK